MTTSLRYRSDIDGLRAISVIAVILFHGHLGVQGGYIGVDVFFVISGFLITSLLVKNLEAGTFSITEFWERRIRRIFPAAWVMTLAVLVAGFVLMMPVAYRQLATDAIAELLLVANVRFWSSASYFGPDASLRPLMHTWSLAVEEQFYIIFPFLLAFSWRFGRRVTTVLFCVIAGASFGLSVWGVPNAPLATFFLLPGRAWELLLGALLAIAPPPQPRSRALLNIMAMVGLLLIVATAFLYDYATPFPGMAALPPCIGTAALIYSGLAQPAFVNRVLSVEWLRKIGLMSYSLYLWHWPIYVFMFYAMGEYIPLEYRILALIPIFVLSYLSWRFVERPIRHIGGPVGLRRVAILAFVASGALLVASFGIRVTDGLPGRFSDEEIRYRGSVSRVFLDVGAWRMESADPDWGGGTAVSIGRKVEDSDDVCFLLWGDSHGVVLSRAIDTIAKRFNLAGAAVLQAGTVPVPGVWRPAQGTESRTIAAAHDDVMSWIRETEPRNVILCSRWSVKVDGYPRGDNSSLIARLDDSSVSKEGARRALVQGLREVVEACDEVGATLWVLTEVPYQPKSAEQRVLVAHITGRPISSKGVTIESHLEHQEGVNAVLKEALPEHVRVVHLADPLFAGTEVSQFSIDGLALYVDTQHVNSRGVEVLAPTIEKILAEVLESCIEDEFPEEIVDPGG